MQFRGAFGPDFPLCIGSPQGEPSIEMVRLQTQTEVASHAAPIQDRPACVVGPEVDNRLQVGIPVVDVCPEDRPKQFILAGAVVEPGKEPLEARVSADAIV